MPQVQRRGLHRSMIGNPYTTPAEVEDLEHAPGIARRLLDEAYMTVVILAAVPVMLLLLLHPVELRRVKITRVSFWGFEIFAGRTYPQRRPALRIVRRTRRRSSVGRVRDRSPP